MGKMNVTGDVMLGLFAEMVLDRALRDFRMQILYQEIDHALAMRDEESFFALAAELNELLIVNQDRV